MGLRFDPVGGGQFKQAVQQIVEAERQPIKALEARKAKEDQRLKLFNEFKSKFSGIEKALSEVSSFRKLRELKVDLGDGTNVASVTLDKERAETGKYVIGVDELASKTSSISNGFPDPDDPVMGVGFVTMYLQDGSSTDIYIDDKNSSLRGIASTINRSGNASVQASVVRDETDSDNPWRLLLTGKKDGAINQVDFPEFYFLDSAADFYIDDNNEAKNASITLDGFPIELQSNDVNDFLTGVNLHLKQARPDQPFTLTISEDLQKVSGKIKALVDQINQVLQFITKQNSVDQNSDTSTTFAGDTTLQSIEYKLRNKLHEGFPAQLPDGSFSKYIYLNEIGVEFDKTGQLTFKEEKFNKSVEKDFESIAQAITGPDGLATQLRTQFDTYTRGSDGFLSLKEQGLRRRIKDIDDQIEQKNMILDKRKQALVERFSRLEGTIGNLQRQQQYLSAALPSGGGGNIVSQLLGG